MTPCAQIEDARERLNRSREIARAIEASLATETARKRGLVEVFLSRGLPLPPPPPREASASADASEETLARENEGGDDIDDEKDANADEETIEGLKRALASSQARAPTSWTPPWTPPSGSRVFVFMYACTCIFRTIGRIARAGPQIFARGAIFILGPKSSNVSTVVPTIATSTRVSLLPVRLAPPNPTEPKDAKSTPVHRRERVER